jgi:hypothetical protein
MLCGQCDESSSSTEQDCHEDYHVITHDLADHLDTGTCCPVQSTAVTIHVRGWADMGLCTGTGDSQPMNNLELVALAAQVASDWFLQRRHQYDITTVGPTAWDPCGYDDSIIHKFGIEYDDRLTAYASTQQRGQTQAFDTSVILEQERYRECTSRIQSLPLNVGANCQLHDTKALELPGALVCKTPEDGIPAPSGSTVSGRLCVAYVLVGSLACGTLTRTKVTAINAASLGNDYYVMVYHPICGEDITGDAWIDTGPFQCCARRVLVECCDTEGGGT